MLTWKLTAIENQNKLRFMCEDEHIAGSLAGILARGHAPKAWRGELYPIRFELEVVETDPDNEIDFNELEKYYEPFVEELDLEDMTDEVQR